MTNLEPFIGKCSICGTTWTTLDVSTDLGCPQCIVKEWKEKFIARFVERGLTTEEGEMDYEAGIDDWDYNEDAKDAADEELSLWCFGQ